MKKGFTLIELLAVIVILAIIAVIATPIVLNIIKDSKENASIRSAEFYLDAVNLSIANRMDDNAIIDGTYQILENGNLCLNYTNAQCSEELIVKVNGEKPTTGTITIVNQRIHSVFVKMNDKELGKYAEGELSLTSYKPGTPIYFNVDTGTVCDEKNVNSNTETKSGCMKFYVINDLGNALDLILDHNTTARVEWTDSSTTVNQNGPKNLLTQLYNDTKNWNGVLTPLDYTLDQRGQISNAYFTVEYSIIPKIEGATTPYKARIISVQEISKVVGHKSWNDSTSTSFYYFDSLASAGPSSKCQKDNTTGCKYGWLYDRTSTSCTNYGCLNNSNVVTNGYWTITTSPDKIDRARYVYFSGRITEDKSINSYDFLGVRPVITISKSKLQK